MLFGYEESSFISPEQVLQKVSQEKIIGFVLEEPFEPNKKYKSPFRNDNNPGCRFELRPDGSYVFIDFGERTLRPDRVHRSVIGMVMDKYGTSMQGAINLICSHFGLSVNTSDYEPVKVRGEVTMQEGDKTVIKYSAIPIAKNDIWYWSQYLIRPEHLKEDNTFCVKEFSVKNHKGYRIYSPYRYCYVFDFVDSCKIYQPYNEPMKWISNCDEDVIGNFDNLPPTGDELVIKKSYKDHRVIRNLLEGSNVVWLMNEGCIPSEYWLVNLASRFKRITIFFDNDYHGVMSAMRLVEVFNKIRPDCCRMIHLPIFINGVKWKDPSTFLNKEGRQDTLTVLKQIGLNGTYP